MWLMMYWCTRTVYTYGALGPFRPFGPLTRVSVFIYSISVSIWSVNRHFPVLKLKK